MPPATLTTPILGWPVPFTPTGVRTPVAANAASTSNYSTSTASTTQSSNNCGGSSGGGSSGGGGVTDAVANPASTVPPSASRSLPYGTQLLQYGNASSSSRISSPARAAFPHRHHNHHHHHHHHHHGGSHYHGSPGHRTPTTPRNAASPSSSSGVDCADLELIKDIPAWLRATRLHKYSAALEGIAWQDLLKMDDQQLMDRGVTALGARRKMLKIFDQINNELTKNTTATTATATTVAIAASVSNGGGSGGESSS
ncbi:hypothetical protein GQ42DRAFT_162282 [Ramicandelaber brevisporus]|nr:hypothetical protein GQ42DRAFT_162282 [Ramicandelaber brevisporus]